MSRNVDYLPRVFILLIIAVALTGCGTSTSASSAPPTPIGSNSVVASGPIFAAWWDPSAGELRTVYGVAGAAHQGQPNYGGATAAFVCMRKNLVLLTNSTGALSLSTLPNGPLVPVTSQDIPKPQIVFSPTCDSALVYSSGYSSALLVQGLPAAPSVSNATLPASAFGLAVGDSGSVLFGVPQTDGSVAIQLLTPRSSTLRFITVLSKLGGLAFLPGGNAALLADAGASNVMEASQLTGNLSLTQVGGPGDGIVQPIAIASSADGRAAAVVNQNQSTIVRIDLTGQTPAVQSVCRSSASELAPLPGNLVFRLNEAGSGTVWAYDGDAAIPRFAFIPTDQTTSAAQGAHR
jgi:hypothetical protein